MVYVFLADGFEEIEAVAPVDILRRMNIPVTTVGVTGKTVVKNTRNSGSEVRGVILELTNIASLFKTERMLIFVYVIENGVGLVTVGDNIDVAALSSKVRIIDDKMRVG